MFQKLSIGACVGAAILIWGSSSMAQTTTATLSGVITDDTGGVITGVEVTITNTATGVRRSLATDGRGRFVSPQLPPGPYEVTATISGFETLVRRGITLAIGQEANLNLAMRVGAVTEQVTVTGEAPLVNTTTSAVSGVVEERRIEALPLNGRDFSQLALVQPGVFSIRNADTNVPKGYGTRISMGGSRMDQTAWLLDGTNIRSTGNFGTPGSVAGLMLGVEAVREFQALTSNYSAEFGGSSGGVINMVTKSGTNELHGSAFEYLRNSALDARNFFNIPSKLPFQRNQFGGSLGGAIKKDKTFFFGNYEQVTQRLSQTIVAIVPNADVHKGLITAPGGGLEQLTVAPSIRPYLDLYPLPNGPELGGGLASLYAPGNESVGENYFVVRGDHRISDKQSLFARFSFDRGNLARPDTLPITESLIANNYRYATVQHDYVMSPQFLMTSRIAYNRSRIVSNPVPLVSYPSSLNIVIPGVLPNLSFPGATGFGPATTTMSSRVEAAYQFAENLQYIHGGHSMKFGVQIDRAASTRDGEVTGRNASFSWATLRDFLLDSRLQSFSASATGSDTYRSYTQYFYGAYFQDDWKMRPNFTWNLGLRYGPFGTPHERQGRESTVKDWVTATAFDIKEGLFKNPSKKYFSPRVGFAWDLRGDSKTALRAGVGLFFMNVLGVHYQLAGQKNPPFFSSTTSVLGNLASFSSDMARVGPSLTSPILTPNTFMELIQYYLDPTYEMKFNLTVERQLPGNLSVSVGYLGNRGIHLWRLSDANNAPPTLVDGRPFVAAGTPRLNQNAGGGTIRYSDAQSFYNGLHIEVKKRFSRSFQFQSSYTCSKNVDDSTTGVGLTDTVEGASSQPYNPKSGRGLSALHLGQVLVVNGVYTLPSPASGLPSVLFGGWGISSIFSANSGTPFSAYTTGRNAPDRSRSAADQFPELVAGRSFSSIILGDPNQYFDPRAFFLPPAGFYGSAGRNILIGPGLVNFDFSLTKSMGVPISEGSRLEFHADFFNVFNRANFATPSFRTVLNATNRQYIAGAGKITRTVTPSRQLQFGLKLVF